MWQRALLEKVTEEDVTLTTALGISEGTRLCGLTEFEMHKRHLFKYTIYLFCF